MRRFLYSMLTLATLLVLALPSAASASVTTRATFTIEGSAFVPCALGGAGEGVLLSGVRRVVLTQTTDAHGVDHGTLHVSGTETGTGLTSGDRYVGSLVNHSAHRFTYDPQGQEVYVETLNYLLVGPGPNNNFRVKFEIHYVRDANGNIRVDRYDYEVFCR